MLIKWCNTQNLIYHLKPMNSRTVFPDYIPWELRTTGRRAPCLPKPLGAVLLLPCLVYFACWKGSEAWQTLQVLTQLPSPCFFLAHENLLGKARERSRPSFHPKVTKWKCKLSVVLSTPLPDTGFLSLPSGCATSGQGETNGFLGTPTHIWKQCLKLLLEAGADQNTRATFWSVLHPVRSFVQGTMSHWDSWLVDDEVNYMPT